MIRLERVGGAWEALVWSEAPTIYLDTWALNLFAETAALRTQFLDLFKDRGTLALSLVGVGEIAAHMAPERPELRSFLESIGPHWIPITNDPFQVMHAQNTVQNLPSACLSSRFINDPDFSVALTKGD